MNAINRAETNRQNAAYSTGPVTIEGRRRASLNAVRHGLTGQTVILPTDDLAAYRETCREFHAELKPVGLLETKNVQAIADTYWRLERIRAMENNLFSLGFEEHSASITTDDPAIHSALAQAKAVQAHSDVLVRLSLYEQRLTRTLTLAEAKLKELQEARRQSQELAFQDAERICKLKKALGQPWLPHDDGFEFSDQQLSHWIHLNELTRQAYDHYYQSRIPKSDTRQLIR